MRRNILVTSATGKQASGLIRTFLAPSLKVLSPTSTSTTPCFPPQLNSKLDSAEHEYNIYALTRRASSVSARSLGVSKAAQDRLHIVQGDLNNRKSIERVFELLKNEDGVMWGVFTILPFPGLGVDASAEEMMGKV